MRRGITIAVVRVHQHLVYTIDWMFLCENLLSSAEEEPLRRMRDLLRDLLRDSPPLGLRLRGEWPLAAVRRLAAGAGAAAAAAALALRLSALSLPLPPAAKSQFRAVLGVFTTVRLNRGAAASNAACASGQRQQH